MSSLPRHALDFVLPLALMGLIFSLSAQPNLSTGLGFWDLILRKLAHLSVYALLTLLWWRALSPLTRHGLLAAALISLLYAASDEFHQSFVDGRHGSPIDVGIDFVGILVAVGLARSARFRSGVARHFRPWARPRA